VLAAFGTTVPSARHVYDRFESIVRQRFPNNSVRWTFTSQIVRDRLAEEGLSVFDPAETLATIANEGHTSVVVQSLHITPGEEFERLASLSHEGLAVQFGKPLMHDVPAIDRLLGLLRDEMRAETPTVLVAHGNGRAEFDGWYAKLIDRAKAILPRAVLASLEGFPGLSPRTEIQSRVAERGEVHFVPLLLVAGDHVLNDIMGEDSESWKNQLGALRATCAPPLGERGKVLEIFLEHLVEAVNLSKE